MMLINDTIFKSHSLACAMISHKKKAWNPLTATSTRTSRVLKTSHSASKSGNFVQLSDRTVALISFIRSFSFCSLMAAAEGTTPEIVVARLEAPSFVADVAADLLPPSPGLRVDVPTPLGFEPLEGLLVGLRDSIGAARPFEDAAAPLLEGRVCVFRVSLTVGSLIGDVFFSIDT
jgi:hypothetical protein